MGGAALLGKCKEGYDKGPIGTWIFVLIVKLFFLSERYAVAEVKSGSCDCSVCCLRYSHLLLVKYVV